MKFTHTSARRRPHLVTGGTLAFLVALSGCGGTQEKRDYKVPDSLCGTTIDSKDLSAFLPSGTKLTTKEATTAQGAMKCRVAVDDRLILTTSQEWWNSMSTLEFARGMTLDDPDHRTKDGKYAYSGNQAFGKVDDCSNSKHKNQILFTAIQATGSKHRDANAMRRLIADYTQAAAKSQCS